METFELSWEAKKELRDQETTDKITQAVKTIMQEINYMGNEQLVGKAIVNEISNTHRTLQQNFFREVIVSIINYFAESHEKGWYDLRNQDSCECALKLKPILKDSGFRFI